MLTVWIFQDIDLLMKEIQWNILFLYVLLISVYAFFCYLKPSYTSNNWPEVKKELQSQ